MKMLAGILAVVTMGGATGIAHAGPVDDAAPYIYERCLESLQNPKGLVGEMAGTRFTLQPFEAGRVLGVSQAYAHPLLGNTRIWEVNEDYGDRVQLGCTMIIDGGDANAQFTGIARELGDAVGLDAAAKLRKQFGDYNAMTKPEIRSVMKLNGDRTLSHVMTKGIPGNPSQGYILSLFYSKPK